MAKPKGKNYINNTEFFEQIVISKNQDFLTKRAEELLVLLAQQAIRKLPYVNNSDREDCLSFAILDMFKYWRSFNPKYGKGNAFAYYTEMAKKGYAKGWNKLHPKKYAGTISMDSRSHHEDSDEGIYTLGY